MCAAAGCVARRLSPGVRRLQRLVHRGTCACVLLTYPFAMPRFPSPLLPYIQAGTGWLFSGCTRRQRCSLRPRTAPCAAGSARWCPSRPSSSQSRSRRTSSGAAASRAARRRAKRSAAAATSRSRAAGSKGTAGPLWRCTPGPPAAPWPGSRAPPTPPRCVQGQLPSPRHIRNFLALLLRIFVFALCASSAFRRHTTEHCVRLCLLL